MCLLGDPAALHLFLERAANGVVVGGVRAHRVGGVRRHGGVGGERRGLGAQLVDLGVARLVALEPPARLIGAARESLGVAVVEPRAPRARRRRVGRAIRAGRRSRGSRARARARRPRGSGAAPRAGRSRFRPGSRCRARARRTWPPRGSSAAIASIALESPERVSAAFSSRACSVDTRRSFSWSGHDLLELALAQERALCELLDVEPEEPLPDG